MSTTKQIVSMLVSENNVTLYTAEAQVLVLNDNGPYNLEKIVEDLTEKLDGKSIVPVDLSSYMNIHTALVPEGYENNGIITTTLIDGREIQGIFFPQKIEVSVKHGDKEVMVPHVENLSRHANRAAKDQSPAVRNFLRRLAPIIAKRAHSAEDLMQFIERSDLPLTHDGMIIGYKRVNEKRPGVFVDVHSGKVQQQVGSRVWMDVAMVDPSRHNSCSNGLHVANLGYLQNFRGTHTLIVLVDPAHFIAVPHGETNKARVSSYDVVGVMTASSHELVSSGLYVAEDQSFKQLISEVVAGRHIRPFEAIKVGDRCVLEHIKLNADQAQMSLEPSTSKTKSSGESLNTDKNPEKKKDLVKMAKTKKTAKVGKSPWATTPQEVLDAFNMLLRGISKAGTARASNISTRTLGRWIDKYDYMGWAKAAEKSMTVAEKARQLYLSESFQELSEFRRAKKKGWESLGFTRTEINRIDKELATD